MVSHPLGLQELLAPHFLLGFTIPTHMEYLNFLRVVELRTVFDESGVVYSGVVSFTQETDGLPVRQHRDPSGAVFEWDDVEIGFRLTIPRDGSMLIKEGVDLLTANPGNLPHISEVGEFFEVFKEVEQDTVLNIPTEYPGFRFRLELMIQFLTLHLTESWSPGKLEGNRIVRDSQSDYKDVKLILPNVILQFEQGDTLLDDLNFEVKSFGNPGFDGPSDLMSGELVRMEPDIAIYKNDRIGFGLSQILVDLSSNNTPAELLELFGIDEAFEGIYLRNARFYYEDKDKDFAFNITLKDLLISWSGRVWFDASFLFMGPDTKLEVDVKIFNGKRPVTISYTKPSKTTSNSIDIEDSAVYEKVLMDGALQIAVRGGQPPYIILAILEAPADFSNSINEEKIIEDIYDRDTGKGELSKVFWQVKPFREGHSVFGDLSISVVDSRATLPQTFSQKIFLADVVQTITDPLNGEEDKDGMPKDRPSSKNRRRKPAQFEVIETSNNLSSDYAILHEPSPTSIAEILRIKGHSKGKVKITPSVLSGNAYSLEVAPPENISIDVPDDSTVQIEMEYYLDQNQDIISPHEFIFFQRGRPEPNELDTYIERGKALAQGQSSATSWPQKDSDFENSVIPWIQFIQENFLANPGYPKSIYLSASASYQNNSREVADQKLSERRLEVAREVFKTAFDENYITYSISVGYTKAKEFKNKGLEVLPTFKKEYKFIKNEDYTPETEAAFQHVKVYGDTPSPSFETGVITGKLVREKPHVEPPANKKETPTPAPNAEKTPTWLRSIGIRLIWGGQGGVFLNGGIVDRLIYCEIFGEIDIETELEKKLWEAQRGEGAPVDPDNELCGGGNDGRVTFSLNVSHDPATHYWTERLALGTAQDAETGIYYCKYNPTEEDEDPRLKDVLGALLVFAPLINQVASGVDSGSTGDWKQVAISLGLPVALGALKVTNVTRIVLYGAEIQFRQYIPKTDDPAEFKSGGIIFDYGVEFMLQIPFLDIRSEEPLKVRYKAVGFQIHSNDGVSYQPIFDTSKGYQLDIANPGLFKLPDPLGNILKVGAARFSRINPLMLELDLELKTDLGIISVDKFVVKWPIDADPVKAPSIVPAGVKVDLSGILEGEGYLNIQDQKLEDGTTGKKIEGAIDITLVHLKIRLAANLRIEPIIDLGTQRRTTAAFASVTVEFPNPLIIAAGLGLYGMSGLFAMHFKRLEDAREVEDTIAPALKWLEKAGGDPTLLKKDGVELWGPAFDQWSLGFGVIIGTLEGGYLINFQGMLVLELPGPRILILIKLDIIEDLPKKEDTEGLTAGILGVIDIDFHLGKLTVGVLLSYEIKEFLSIQVPGELLFDMNNGKNWHLYLGRHNAMASADVLGITKAKGYFMIEGDQIAGFPPGTEGILTGTAVAAGLEASVTIGDTSIGLYLKVALAAHIGISFSPELALVGQIKLEGELRLFIVSIGASGTFDVLVSGDITYVHGEVCGKVSFFFFSVGGCVNFTIGSPAPLPPAPPLIRGVYLQSFAPVLTAGQGGDRPIDASLGNAILHPAQVGDKLPIVPIDSNVVIQLAYPPRIRKSENEKTITFSSEGLTKPPPNLPSEGWIALGGKTVSKEERVARYFLKEIRLEEIREDQRIPYEETEPVPMVWRKDDFIRLKETAGSVSGSSTNTNIELALFSRTPTTAARALERSEELTRRVVENWGSLCQDIAPPTTVFYSFCTKPLGPSGSGWELSGSPWPDPPGTIRTTPPPIQLYVGEPAVNSQMVLQDGMMETMLGFEELPAQVVSLMNLKPGCNRALDIGRRRNYPILEDDLQTPVPGILDYAEVRNATHWIRFRVNTAKSVGLYFALPRVFNHSQGEVDLLISQLDSQGTVMASQSFTTLAPTTITVFNQLPPKWQNNQGPWAAKAYDLFTRITQPEFSDLQQIYLQFHPKEEVQEIELRIYNPQNLFLDLHRVLVLALEIDPKEEHARFENEKSIQKGGLKELGDYFALPEKSGLLKPDTEYSLTVFYESETNDDGSDPKNWDAEYRFRTDNEAPLSLEPYVLATTPGKEEGFHFYDDSVKVVFNDALIFKLVKAYQKAVKIVLRRADGLPVPMEEDEILETDPVSGLVDSPFKDTLLEQLGQNLLPCLQGTHERTEHVSYTLKAALKPLTEYTLELVYYPPGVLDLNSEKGVMTPLFKRQFRTSRYQSPQALATDIQWRQVTFRALQKEIILPDPLAGELVAEVPDRLIEQALMDAGEQALPGANTTEVKQYWAPRADGSYYLHALLMDASEPLWRYRVEPALQTLADQEDESFQIIVPRRNLSMGISSNGVVPISKFVVSPSGTRTVVFVGMQDPAVQQEEALWKLFLHRPASVLYGLSEETIELIEIIVNSKPPWEYE